MPMHCHMCEVRGQAHSHPGTVCHICEGRDPHTHALTCVRSDRPTHTHRLSVTCVRAKDRHTHTHMWSYCFLPTSCYSLLYLMVTGELFEPGLILLNFTFCSELIVNRPKPEQNRWRPEPIVHYHYDPVQSSWSEPRGGGADLSGPPGALAIHNEVSQAFLPGYYH